MSTVLGDADRRGQLPNGSGRGTGLARNPGLVNLLELLSRSAAVDPDALCRECPDVSWSATALVGRGSGDALLLGACESTVTGADVVEPQTFVC